jgi:hypothetical protein
MELIRKIGRLTGLSKTLVGKGDDAEFIAHAFERFEAAAEAEKSQRQHEVECLRMCDPDKQWDDSIKAGRLDDERPCMTEDRINPFVSVVCNSLRQNRAAVTVNPVDDASDTDTAEVIQGLIRHITYDSSADLAYDTASTSCVRTGRGYYRIVTEYEGDDSFDQVIKVKAIPNHHMVYVDPNAVEADYSDADWFMIFEDMLLSDFRDVYGDKKSSELGLTQWQSVGDDAPGWFKDGHIRVCEYFYKSPKKIKLYLITGGEVLKKEDLPEGVSPKVGSKVAEQTYIEDIRDCDTFDVKWAKFNAVEVLERRDWAGKIIPIIPVLGKELIINNERRYFGLVSSMIDPQKRFNWLLSAQLETINLVPRTPWVAVEGSLVRPNVWANAHKRPVGVLTYKQDLDGTPVTARPERAYSGADVSAVNQALQFAAEGMKGTSGMYNPSIGATETSSQSGVAIRSQQAQGDMATYHFQDAVTRARRKEGRIILELIPQIYDAERVVRIVNEDETAKVVRVNGVDEDGKLFDLTQGKYDLTVTSGPSYTTRRQENLAVLMSMAQSIPAIANAAPDLVVSQLDVPIAKPLAKRLKATLPPQLQADEDKNKPDVGVMMQKMQQSQQVIEQLTQALNAAQDEHQLKIMEFQTKKEIAAIQADATVRAAFIRSESTQLAEDSRALLGYEMNVNQALNSGVAGQSGVPQEGETTAGSEAGMEE